MTSTVGEEAEAPAITNASIGAPAVESPMVHRSPAKVTAGDRRHANTPRRKNRCDTRLQFKPGTRSCPVVVCAPEVVGSAWFELAVAGSECRSTPAPGLCRAGPLRGPCRLLAARWGS